MFAELEAVCVSGTQKVRKRAWYMGFVKLRSHKKDFCLCPQNEWEMSFLGFLAGNNDQFCSVESSLWR